MFEENLNIEVCGICLEELEISEEFENIYKTICGHTFHHDCIHKSMKKNNNCPYCRKEIQTQSAFCIYEIINSAMFEGDYAYTLETGIYSEVVDENCYFTKTPDSLYFIMYIFANDWICVNQTNLLLTIHSYNNNIRFYPKKILQDYKKIAEYYDRWDDFSMDYELDLDTNKISLYISDNKRKNNSVLFMNKTIEWNLYEKEYENDLIQNFSKVTTDELIEKYRDLTKL